MFQVKTEKDFLDAFRPRDRKHVELPPDLKFPLFVQDYYAWIDPAGARVFLLFAAPGERQFTGIAFRRDQSSAGARSSSMCEWCHASASADEIGLLTADVNSRKRVGVSLCLDLRCGARVEEAADRSGRNARVMAKQVLTRMDRFAREGLGIRPDNRE